ncbi:serine/arginine repetitive matrix protein 3-like [Mirounga angustirostris]|uniref:serine/arginine repetitive matrix protein 3-like n=1 Tax=Mirounga angustirostris TaxID=9716 RepID=UPI00313D926A
MVAFDIIKQFRHCWQVPTNQEKQTDVKCVPLQDSKSDTVDMKRQSVQSLRRLFEKLAGRDWSSAYRFPRRGGGRRGSSKSQRGSPTRPGRTETNSRAPTHPRLPPPPASTPGQEAQSKQVSEARHRGTLFAPAALTSVCERAPGAGRLARGPRGERSGGQRRPRPLRAEAGCARGSPAAESAPEAAPRLAGRTRRRWSAAAAAAAAASSSSQAASAGRLLGLGQHFPAVSHTPLRERGLLHTRAHPRPHAPLEKSKISETRAKGVAEVKARQRCADLGVPSERQQREGRAGAGGARPTQFVRRSPSARGLRGPDWHPWRRPCGLGRETAAAPPHIPGLRAEAERWPLPHERLKARTLARESREVHRRATPRTATEGRCPPTIPRNSPGKARTQSPTTTNYAVEFPTFGEIAGVSTSGVQWISLALGKPPS